MTLMKVLGLLCVMAFAQACENQHIEEMLPNYFEDFPSGSYATQNLDTATASGNEALITTANAFALFDGSSTTWTVTDQGALYLGDVTTAVPDISGLTTVGSVTNAGVLAPAWFAAGATTEYQYEWRVELTSDHGADNAAGDDTIIGDFWCPLETIAESIHQSKKTGEFPLETIIVTWRFSDTTDHSLLLGNFRTYSALQKFLDSVFLTQLVVVYTDQGNTYSFMHHSGTVISPTLWYVGNGHYTNTGAAKFATVCDVGNGLDVTNLANSFCGKKGGVMWSLKSGDECADATICANLNVNLMDRNPNCNELITPADSCFVNGSCQYVTPLNDYFEMSYIFDKTVAKYVNWAVLDSVITSPNYLTTTGACILTATDNGDTFTVTKQFQNTLPGLCNINYDAGTGVYTIILLNYDANEAVTSPAPTWFGQEIYKKESKMFAITCRPDDFPFTLSHGVTIGNDIHTTTVDATSDRTVTLGFGTMLDGNNANFRAFGAGAAVNLGTPLFPYVEFFPGTQYTQNVDAYSVYIKECWFGNAADFSDRKRLVVQNRCRKTNVGAFKLLDEFQDVTAIAAYGDLVRVVGGPVRAARWINPTQIWLQCEIDFCTNTGFYANSYCANSCTGTGRDAVGNRKRRDAEEDTSVILTTHITIRDEIESAAESCADSTLAYAAISALCVMLLVATVFAVLLAVKLQNKKKA